MYNVTAWCTAFNYSPNSDLFGWRIATNHNYDCARGERCSNCAARESRDMIFAIKLTSSHDFVIGTTKPLITKCPLDTITVCYIIAGWWHSPFPFQAHFWFPSWLCWCWRAFHCSSSSLAWASGCAWVLWECGTRSIPGWVASESPRVSLRFLLLSTTMLLSHGVFSTL